MDPGLGPIDPFGLGVWALLAVGPPCAGGDANPPREGDDSNDEREDDTSIRVFPAFSDRFSSEMIWNEDSSDMCVRFHTENHLELIPCTNFAACQVVLVVPLRHVEAPLSASPTPLLASRFRLEHHVAHLKPT